MGVNQANVDILDRIGSDYWFAYSVVTSGIVVIAIALIYLDVPRENSQFSRPFSCTGEVSKRSFVVKRRD